MRDRIPAPADGQRGDGGDAVEADASRAQAEPGRARRGAGEGARQKAAQGIRRQPAADSAAQAEDRSSRSLKPGQSESLKPGASALPGARRPGADEAGEAASETAGGTTDAPAARQPAPDAEATPKRPGAQTSETARAKATPPSGRAKPDGKQADAKGGKAPARDRPGVAEAAPVPRPVTAARAKPRHGLVVLLFLLMVVGPVSGAGWYLYARATDQYASTLGFSVRKEEGPSASELLGGIASLSGASSSDTDVLNEFIQSQEMVERVDALLDLRAIYSEPGNDPLFTVDADASIEDLVDYWNRMVTVYYDGGVGLIEVRVLAFDPDDARAIARAIFDESSEMINDLTAIARADATRYARQELEAAVERLRVARAELTEFRTRTQIVDPNADIQGQMGLLNTLQAQLAESLIELDLLGETTRDSDPRIRQTEQRIAVIEKRIAEERAKFGISDNNRSGQAYASLVGEYESLVVNREFAESAYLTALTNFDAAQAEAQRQSRYLAAHIKPTLAQSSEYPRRATILATFALFAAMAWATASLIYYSVRDRR